MDDSYHNRKAFEFGFLALNGFSILDSPVSCAHVICLFSLPLIHLRVT
jgi:hypothetical protein